LQCRHGKPLGIGNSRRGLRKRVLAAEFKLLLLLFSQLLLLLLLLILPKRNPVVCLIRLPKFLLPDMF
jgi:hypothetical protein